MKMRAGWFWIVPAVCLCLWGGAVSAVELTDNLFVDGGMEGEWTETGPDSGGWSYLTVSCKGLALTKNAKGNLLTPKILSQYNACSVMKLEEQDVHSGKRAMRLKGEFYLNSVPGSHKIQAGDEFIVEYWVKGSGETVMHIHVPQASGQIIKRSGKPIPGEWTKIEERIQVEGKAPEGFAFRLFTSEEMLVDDISVRRVMREGEVKLKPILPELSTRAAFASGATEPITLDGRLDEPSWKKAIRVDGMRAYLDQTSLARAADGFRVLYDDGALYLGIEVMQPDCPQVFERLKGDPLKNRDGSPHDKNNTYSGRHSVELFLQPPERSRYYQLAASLDGYRFDGAGMDGDWNGTWEFAVQAEADRWVLEIRIPASDFELAKLAKDSRWRMNICINKEGLSSTWAAVGPAFHNPDAFGELILSDFPEWCATRSAGRADILKRIKEESAVAAVDYSDRLSAIESYTQGMKDDGAKDMDWETMIKRYALLNYVDYSYRCIQEEINYRVALRGRAQ